MTAARPGVFVTGTDTGIGKTIVSACLVRRWAADYWKPAQTGLAEDEPDSDVVARLTGARVHTPRWALQAPLSPEAAARREGVRIALEDFALPHGRSPIVVEGAGGVLVPLGGGATMADLMRRLGLPVLLVARTTLGTINHTLLSLEALRARGLCVFGVVMVGADGAENAEAIARLGKARILATLPLLNEVSSRTLVQSAPLFPSEPPTARKSFFASFFSKKEDSSSFSQAPPK